MSESKQKPKSYYAVDMYDIQSLAKCDMNWMQTALDRVRRDFMRLSEQLQKNYEVDSIYFDELQTVLNMYSYLAEERHAYHAETAKQYENEWKNEGGDQ